MCCVAYCIVDRFRFCFVVFVAFACYVMSFVLVVCCIHGLVNVDLVCFAGVVLVVVLLLFLMLFCYGVALLLFCCWFVDV